MPRPRPKRVITVYCGKRKSGLKKRLALMVAALLEQGFEVHYVSTRELSFAPHEKLVAHVIRPPMKLSEGFVFWFCVSFVVPFFLLRIVLFKRFSAIIVSDTYYCLLAKLASVVTRTPSIMFMRSVPWRVDAVDHSSPIARTFYRCLDHIGLYCASRIVAVTATMQQELASKLPFYRKRVVLIPNAVVLPLELSEKDDSEEEWEQWRGAFITRKRALARRFNLSERAVFFATSGELVRRKNISHLVRAIGACDNDRIVLILCGDGVEREHVLSLVIGYGLAEQVVFARWVDDLFEVLTGIDLFVMPSRFEGMSNSLLEALGAGCAVIAADTPEMREVLSHEELLFNPTHVGHLAEKLNQIANKKETLQEIKQLSVDRRQSLKFDWGEQVAELIRRL